VAGAGARFQVERVDPDGGPAEVRIGGRLLLGEAGALWAALHAILTRPLPSVVKPDDPTLVIDLAKLEAVDAGALALVLALKGELEAQGARVSVRSVPDAIKPVLDIVADRMSRPTLKPPPQVTSTLEQIGGTTLAGVAGARGIFDFVGRTLRSALGGVVRPGTINWPDATRTLERAGADGLPIVLMLGFLIGLIIAFQSAIQLEQFGATVYVAPAVALSITRELGPLMTAIIVAGRSGAAFAAELGTMRVSEEVDALATMGIDPYRYLVVPRVVALVIAMPLLTMLADIVGILGGLVVGLTLDQTIVGYMNGTRAALGPWDVLQGLEKSVVFGLAVSLIACQRGLSTSGGAEGVGRSTTSAVVTSLFFLVLIDAAFTVVFHAWNL
jgi:phospholipid/cholesterol/gamma-HCH transport system permease protein